MAFFRSVTKQCYVFLDSLVWTHLLSLKNTCTIFHFVIHNSIIVVGVVVVVDVVDVGDVIVVVVDVVDVVVVNVVVVNVGDVIAVVIVVVVVYYNSRVERIQKAK